jgi:hypothetical protein
MTRVFAGFAALTAGPASRLKVADNIENSPFEMRIQPAM